MIAQKIRENVYVIYDWSLRSRFCRITAMNIIALSPCSRSLEFRILNLLAWVTMMTTTTTMMTFLLHPLHQGNLLRGLCMFSSQ